MYNRVGVVNLIAISCSSIPRTFSNRPDEIDYYLDPRKWKLENGNILSVMVRSLSILIVSVCGLHLISPLADN